MARQTQSGKGGAASRGATAKGKAAPKKPATKDVKIQKAKSTESKNDKRGSYQAQPRNQQTRDQVEMRQASGRMNQQDRESDPRTVQSWGGRTKLDNAGDHEQRGRAKVQSRQSDAFEDEDVEEEDFGNRSQGYHSASSQFSSQPSSQWNDDYDDRTSSNQRDLENDNRYRSQGSRNSSNVDDAEGQNRTARPGPQHKDKGHHNQPSSGGHSRT